MAIERNAIWRRLLMVLSGMLLAAFVANAQEPRPKPAQTSAWAVYVMAKLHLDAAQSAAFQHYVATTSPPPEMAAKSPDEYRAMTSPQRLDYFAANFEAALTKIHVTASALHAFYGTLTPAQRTLFDDSMVSHPGHLATESETTSEGPPPAPNLQVASHVDPEWAVKPTSDDVARVYPTTARAANVSGKVAMSCVADIDGFLTECVIQDETPPRYGFGNAALEISAYMRMKPASNFGVPTRAKVNVPVNFMPEVSTDQH